MAGSEENQSPSFKILLIIYDFSDPFRPGPYFFPAPSTTVGGSTLPLPAYYLYLVFPMFRSYARFGLLAYLALALLAAAASPCSIPVGPKNIGSRPWPSCC